MTEPQVSTPGETAPTEPAAITRLRSQTFTNLLLSMGLIGGIIALVMLVSWRPQPDPIHEIEARPVAEQVAASVTWPVLFPRVEDGWRATSARFRATEESDDKPVWFNGWVTPDAEFVAVVQSSTTDDDFIAEQTANGFTVVDRTGFPPELAEWDATITRNGETRSLVRTENGLTTIVTGTLDWAGLQSFVDRLEPVG